MDVTENRTVTITFTAAEATEYWIEVWEMLGLLKDGPDQGNTRTGLVRIREIRDAIGALGLGVTPANGVPYGGPATYVPPPPYTGQVVAAAQGYVPPAPPPWAPR